MDRYILVYVIDDYPEMDTIMLALIYFGIMAVGYAAGFVKMRK